MSRPLWMPPAPLTRDDRTRLKVTLTVIAVAWALMGAAWWMGW